MERCATPSTTTTRRRPLTQARVQIRGTRPSRRGDCFLAWEASAGDDARLASEQPLPRARYNEQDRPSTEERLAPRLLSRPPASVPTWRATPTRRGTDGSLTGAPHATSGT